MGNDPANGIDPDGMQVTGAGGAGPIQTMAEESRRISWEATMQDIVGFNTYMMMFYFSPGYEVSLITGKPIGGGDGGGSSGSGDTEGVYNSESEDDPSPQQNSSTSKTPFPEFSEILSNYPLPYEKRPDRTPSDPETPVDDEDPATFLYNNQCAIRLSIALKKSGVSLKNAKNITNPKGNPYGNGNILGATNLAWFLRDKYLGKPEVYDGTREDVRQRVSGRQGILYFQNIVEQGPRGPARSAGNVHIELWNKTRYMSNFSFSQMFGGTVIWFWQLK